MLQLQAIAHTLMFCAIGAALAIVVAFAVSFKLKRLDVVDIAWGLMFITIAIAAYLVAGHDYSRPIITLMLITLWGLRLTGHIWLRFVAKKSEDRRYTDIRAKYATHPVLAPFLRVFVVQAVLAVIISLPMIIVATTSDFNFGWISGVGVLLWVIGFVFETLGDSQLSRFVNDPRRKAGKLMTTGLWRYARHPNYFGELLQWWAIALIALPVPFGWLGLLGPLILSILIIRVTGVPLLEKNYAGRADWEAYKAQTNKLIPGPVKKSRAEVDA